jgi:hypothetical protein
LILSCYVIYNKGVSAIGRKKEELKDRDIQTNIRMGCVEDTILLVMRNAILVSALQLIILTPNTSSRMGHYDFRIIVVKASIIR